MFKILLYGISMKILYLALFLTLSGCGVQEDKKASYLSGTTAIGTPLKSRL